MKTNTLSKEVKKLDKKLKELGKVSKKRTTQIKSSDSYQFHISHRETSQEVEKKQKHTRWVLINQRGQLVGRLDYNPLNTKESARKWFYDTKRMVNKHANFDDLFRVLTNDEFEELKKNNKERIRFASPNASIYKDYSADNKNSKDAIKKKEYFFEFISRAPISFDDKEEE